jgi:hypothetical protein
VTKKKRLISSTPEDALVAAERAGRLEVQPQDFRDAVLVHVEVVQGLPTLVLNRPASHLGR